MKQTHVAVLIPNDRLFKKWVFDNGKADERYFKVSSVRDTRGMEFQRMEYGYESALIPQFERVEYECLTRIRK